MKHHKMLKTALFVATVFTAAGANATNYLAIGTADVPAYDQACIHPALTNASMAAKVDGLQGQHGGKMALVFGAGVGVTAQIRDAASLEALDVYADVPAAIQASMLSGAGISLVGNHEFKAFDGSGTQVYPQSGSVLILGDSPSGIAGLQCYMLSDLFTEPVAFLTRTTEISSITASDPYNRIGFNTYCLAGDEWGDTCSDPPAGGPPTARH